MESENVQIIAQMLQGILVASSALAGFSGILIIEIAKLFERDKSWSKVLIGFITLASGISFVFCMVGAINWFEDQRLYSVLQLTSGFDGAKTWFWIQLVIFLLMFVSYIGGKFFSDTKR